MISSTEVSHTITLFDAVILALCAGITAAAFVFAARRAAGHAELKIQTPNAEYRYDLSQNRTVTVKGAIGDTVISIADGAARFVRSPCPNQTCVQHAPVRKPGDWSACMPNRVFIQIEADSNGGADVIAE